MTAAVASLPAQATLDDALLLFDRTRVGGLPVVDGEVLPRFVAVSGATHHRPPTSPAGRAGAAALQSSRATLQRDIASSR